MGRLRLSRLSLSSEERRYPVVVSLRGGAHLGGGRRHALEYRLCPLPLRQHRIASGLVRQILPPATVYQERGQITQLGYTGVHENGFNDYPLLM